MIGNALVQPPKRGRPATGKGTPVQVRLQPDDLKLLDLWIADNQDMMRSDVPKTRPEAIRRMMQNSLNRMRAMVFKAEAKSTAKAMKAESRKAKAKAD